jgi:hypothetical protein
MFEHFRQVGDTELEASEDGTLSHPARAGGMGLLRIGEVFQLKPLMTCSVAIASISSLMVAGDFFSINGMP